MSKQKNETLTNLNTRRIMVGTGVALALAGAGIRINQLNRADNLGRAQYRADHPNKHAPPRVIGVAPNHSAEKDK